MSTTTKAVHTAEDKFADELIRQHLAGHITVRGIIGEAFRQGVMHGETKSGALEMLEALEGLIENSQHMSPFGGAGKISDVRKAGKYLKALDKAKAAIQKARGVVRP